MGAYTDGDRCCWFAIINPILQKEGGASNLGGLRGPPFLWQLSGARTPCCCRHRCLPSLGRGSRRTLRKIPGPWRHSWRGRGPSCGRKPAWVKQSPVQIHLPRPAGWQKVWMQPSEAFSLLGSSRSLQDVPVNRGRQQVVHDVHR